MNIHIVAASAGTGKTYRLTEELDHSIASGRVRPEAIIATTFTAKAAAELIERARARLLHVGRARDAQRLLAARIGTVNAVCGALVTEFAFELGISPQVRVLDDAASDLELRRALARVVSEGRATELDGFRDRFERARDWRIDVATIIDAARANDLGAETLAASAERSCRELDVCLDASTADDLDRLMAAAISEALAGIAASDDATKGTAAYVQTLRTAQRDLASRRGLAWGAWATLARQVPTKHSLGHAAIVQQVAHRHVEHPRLRRDLRRLITLLFEVAADTVHAYQEHKREIGVIDFIDQEALALALLRKADVRDALEGQLDLFLVDEFQDTSPIQLALFLELAKVAPESVWVGDSKQAIFGFRGTDPSLMDTAIESLTTPRVDADLIERAAETVGRCVETLGVSHRSRPALVTLTSEIFARAFERVGIPPERTRLVPHLLTEPEGLGPIVEYWPLDLDRSVGTDNAPGRAAAVAAGVRDLIAREPSVRRHPTGVGAARPRDLAVLCRTNKQAQAVADALAMLHVRAVVPRTGLLDTAEAQVVRAGLALWIDPDDALAAAELARVITYATNLDALIARVLESPGRDAFRGDPIVARLLARREVDHDLAPAAAVELIIDAVGLRELCAGWGESAQRLANLDALRAHATVYATEAAKSSRAATLGGLLRHFDRLAPRVARWDETATDRQALLAAEDAVTVSTWHGAKGLEWPITILFGLESIREPSSYGVHVVTDRASFDVNDPLGGRWIRYWPNPYVTPNQLGAVRSACERSVAHSTLVAKADREALRVLYVGWTRARDRLILAAQRGHFLDGILGKLAVTEPTTIAEPPADGRACWAGVDVAVHVASAAPAGPVNASTEPGTITIGRGAMSYPPARTSPSAAEPVACVLGETVILGPRIAITSKPNMEAIGDVVHAFLAADREDPARFARAARLLGAYGVDGCPDASALVTIASRLWRWAGERFPGAAIHREWPVTHRKATGTTVVGTVDVVIAADDGFVVVDHKTFPGRSEDAADRALGYSGQLAAYAAAIEAATEKRVLSTWIHFPIRGQLVEVRLGQR
ncbi:MAG TPA: UvrD-helicase domain-containing protein [Kofleriaceae bacterium]|nr:UvrD-helicase domain-containing protein [Kofleriaceae bacterium]